MLVAELAQTAKSPMGPSEGEYQSLQELAAGGMGSVYLARATSGPRKGQIVALKRMHPHLERNPQFAASFFDEAWITAGLRHPNVVDIFDWGTDKEGRYIALEFVPGESLLNVLKATRSRGLQMPIDIVLFVLARTAEALHAAHELRNERGELRHLVHRDVTPSNVLVSRDGAVKLIDFGVAKARERLQDNTQTNTLKGKFGYMSPEQARGTKNIDRRSDLWSLGVVLWECLAGKRLFKSDSELEILRMVTEETPASVRSVRPEVPEAVDRLLMSVFAKNRDDRIGSCAEFADYLWAVFREEGFTTNEQSLSRYFHAMLPERCEALDRLLLDGNGDYKLESIQSGSGSGSFQGSDPRSGAVALPIAKGPTGSFPAYGEDAVVRPTEMPEAPAANRKVVGLLFGVVVLLAGALGTVLYTSRTGAPASGQPQTQTTTIAQTTPPRIESSQGSGNQGVPSSTHVATQNPSNIPTTPSTVAETSDRSSRNGANVRRNGAAGHGPAVNTGRANTLPANAAANAMLVPVQNQSNSQTVTAAATPVVNRPDPPVHVEPTVRPNTANSGTSTGSATPTNNGTPPNTGSGTPRGMQLNTNW